MERKENISAPNLRQRIGNNPRPVSTSTPVNNKKTTTRKRKISLPSEDRTVKQKINSEEAANMIPKSPAPAPPPAAASAPLAHPVLAPASLVLPPGDDAAATTQKQDSMTSLQAFLLKLDGKMDTMSDKMENNFGTVNESVRQLNAEAVKTNAALSAAAKRTQTGP